MTELERALLHIKTRADAWAVKEVEKALSQEPCDDAVSREAVLDEIDDTNRRGGFGGKLSYTRCRGHIEQLPPVTPKPVECNDAISRDMALEKMADYVASGYADSVEDFEEYSRIVCQLPPVTQKSGKWKYVPDADGFYICSECRCGNEYADNYCPNCGAKMESEE